MLRAKKNLLTFLMIAISAFSTPSIAADQDLLLPEGETLTGRLDIMIADDFNAGVSHRAYSIRVRQTDGSYRSIPLSFASIPPESNLRSGDQVIVRGELVDDIFAIHSLQHMEKTTSATPSAPGESFGAPLTGTRKAVMLIVHMNDAENEYKTPAEIIPMLYTGTRNVKNLYEASSYGKLSFDPNTDGAGQEDVFGPYTIDSSVTEDCRIGNPLFTRVINEWAEKADDQAIAAGIDLMQYQHRIYIFPNEVNCGWVGMGSTGCPEATSNYDFDCRAWVVADPEEPNEGRYVAHELGHNLGWDHSSTSPPNLGEPIEEYGDESGIMGHPRWAQANAPHRDQLGWFDDFPGSVVTEPCSADFALNALELTPEPTPARPHVVKIPISNTGEYIYLSYRREIGNYPSLARYADRISVHRHNGESGNTLLVADLGQDETYEDPDTGIKVTATSVGAPNNTAAISAEIPNHAPSAAFSSSATDGHLNIQFTDQSSDRNGNIESFQWEIDGQTLTERNPTHRFASSGKYSVTLTVTDECGLSDVETGQVTVLANVAPKADFTYEGDHLTVQFNDASQDDDGSIASRQWNFGDGSTPVTATDQPSHTYADIGTYEVTLTVTDDDDATHSESKTIEVVNNQPPQAGFDATTNGLEVQFNETSTDSDGDIATYHWEFGDGTSSDEQNPVHTYSKIDTYTVTLTVSDDDDAPHTATQEINLDQVNPQALVPSSGGGGGGCFIDRLLSGQ